MRDYAFGNLIANLRTARGYSQFQLGTLLGVSDKAISKWENGDAKPRLATCGRLAELLGISVNELLSASNSVKREMAVQEAVMDQKENIRHDTAAEKRVELHLHTGMSGIGNFGDVYTYLQLASDWGHSAIAVTDSCVTMAFLDFSRMAERSGIKPIYGCELWVIPEPESEKNDGFAVMVLVKNRQGLVHLNRLVTDSHIKYIKDGTPCVPKNLLEQMRDGLLVGASCSHGEIGADVLDQDDSGKLERIVAFYDYLEVQPPRTNMIEDKDTTARIISLGEKYGKPVAAVGNVHFTNPDEGILYNAMMYSNGETDCTGEVPYWFRTTDEMLEAFSFLGDVTANEIVVTNTRKIADLIEDKISLFPDLPVGRNNFYPVWPEADDELTKIVYERAHVLYGDDLPEIVGQRITQEMKIITENDYATIYMINRGIVKKSNDAGYPVMFRGGAASSLVAMLCGITSINPLPPHYRCSSCMISDFNIDTRAYRMGADLPDKVCPVCGEKMQQDGFNIPFETLLGRNGEKVPDFDINVVPEFQRETHKYVAELNGMDQVLMCGTILGVNNEYISKVLQQYTDDHGVILDDGQFERLTNAYRGMLKYTGQHPGGVEIIPEGYDITDFLPYQYPANDVNSSVVTTHYDHFSMRDELLKLDILAHDTPNILHRLHLLTNIDPETVPLNDPKVLELFSTVDPLGVKCEDILSKTGTYGIKEFASEWTREKLTKLKPTTFSELVAISGMSHGTDVWGDNAEVLIDSGIARLMDCAAVREDIMDEMLAHGIDRQIAYKTMESVRKGRGIPDSVIPVMKKAGIPAWYISSCQKIRYLFPRAHAICYVKAAVQLAWYKFYYPTDFYAAWMYLLTENTELEDMFMDMKELRRTILSLRNEEHTVFRDNDRGNALEMFLEMKARGINPMPELPDGYDTSFGANDLEKAKGLAQLLIDQGSPFIRSLRLSPKTDPDGKEFLKERLEMGLPADEVLTLYAKYFLSGDDDEKYPWMADKRKTPNEQK